MIESRSYRIAFIVAISLHLCIAILLFSEPKSERPVLNLAAPNQTSLAQPVDETKEQVIKAVSVDSQEVMETVNRLKQEKIRQQTMEANRQRALTLQAEMAKKARVEEQKRLEALKQEEEKIAIMRKKQLQEEQERLKELAKQKAEEEKRIAAMKQQQLQMQKEQQEAARLAELKKQKELETQKALAVQKAIEAQKVADAQKAALEAQRVQEARARALAEQQRQAQALQAAMDANKAAQLSGEVNKYKALIINAISRQWILPENANSNMSSQFRIRLAPNGAVLEVTLTKSSGDPILDRSAQSAIYKASPLPVPSDAETFNVFRDISLTVRPESARG